MFDIGRTIEFYAVEIGVFPHPVSPPSPPAPVAPPPCPPPPAVPPDPPVPPPPPSPPPPRRPTATKRARPRRRATPTSCTASATGSAKTAASGSVSRLRARHRLTRAAVRSCRGRRTIRRPRLRRPLRRRRLFARPLGGRPSRRRSRPLQQQHARLCEHVLSLRFAAPSFQTAGPYNPSATGSVSRRRRLRLECSTEAATDCVSLCDCPGAGVLSTDLDCDVCCMDACEFEYDQYCQG